MHDYSLMNPEFICTINNHQADSSTIESYEIALENVLEITLEKKVLH